MLACAARAAEHWQDSTPRYKAIAISLRGLGHTLNKDYPAAIVAHSESLEIKRSLSPESDTVVVELNWLADIKQRNKDYPAAERDYREALRIAKIIKNEERVATIMGNLASLALDREQWVEAESLAREALALAEKVGRQELIAWDCHILANALLKQNPTTVGAQYIAPLHEALSLARRAVEIYTRLRQQDSLQSAQETLAEIKRAMQKSE